MAKHLRWWHPFRPSQEPSKGNQNCKKPLRIKKRKRLFFQWFSHVKGGLLNDRANYFLRPCGNWFYRPLKLFWFVVLPPSKEGGFFMYTFPAFTNYKSPAFTNYKSCVSIMYKSSAFTNYTSQVGTGLVWFFA